jgi:hypothetical protein
MPRNLDEGAARMSKNRREFLRTAFVLGAIPPLAALLRPQHGAAQEPPRLAEDDPTAVALAYVHDATKAKNPRYQAGQTCENCQQLQGEAGQAWRPCAIFPGKVVAAGGWCSVWVQKAK